MRLKKRVTVLMVMVIFIISSISSYAMTGSNKTKSNKFYIGKYEAIQFNNTKGRINKQGKALKITGGARWYPKSFKGNNGNFVCTVDKFLFMNKRLDTKFTFYSNKYKGIGTGVRGVFYSHSNMSTYGKNNVIIKNGDTIYRSLLFKNDGIYEYTCRGNYYGKPKAKKLYFHKTPMTDDLRRKLNSPQSVAFYIDKNKDGTSAYILAQDINITNLTLNADKRYVDGHSVVQVEKTDGALVQQGDTLKMVGGAHTNSKVVNGRRDGNFIATVDKFSFMNKRLDTKFAFHSNKYAALNSGVKDVFYGHSFMSTHHSREGSLVINNGDTIYRSFLFKDDAIYEYTCRGDYYGKPNSRKIYEYKTPMTSEFKKKLKSPRSVAFYFTDNYDGKSAYMLAQQINITDLNKKATKYTIDNHEVVQFNQTDGELVQKGNHLKMIGGKYSAGKLIDDRRDGNFVSTVKKFVFMNKRLDTKLSFHSNSSANIGTGIRDVFYGNATPSIKNGETIYRSLIFKNDGIYEYTCKGNYYGKSNAKKIYEHKTPMTDKLKRQLSSPQSIAFYISHNRAGKSAYIIAQEINITNTQGGGNNTTTNGHANIGSASGWAKEEIQLAEKAGLYTKKIMEGNFKSNATREEFAELVVKMYEKLGGKVSNNTNPFGDTKNPSVIKAYNAGIIRGMSATEFMPNRNLTREQMCVMLMRAIRNTGKVYELRTGFQKYYADIDEISDWAKEDVEILNAYKIINGDGRNLSPRANVTKEQAVLMLYRAYMMFK